MFELDKYYREKIKNHIETRKEFKEFVTTLFTTIGEKVKHNLSADYPEVEYKYLISRSPEVIAKFEKEYGQAPDVGWVAMSFHGHSLYSVHIGTLFDFGYWPITYSIGFHILDREWQQFRKHIDSLEWENHLGLLPNYEYCKPNGEHMYNDREKELLLKDLDQQIDEIVKRISQYYTTVAPIVSK